MKWQLHELSFLFFAQGYQNKDSHPSTYFTYRIANSIDLSVHSGYQRSTPLHFCEMKELQTFLENNSLLLAEVFDKCFDIGLTSNMPLLAEKTVRSFCFIVCLKKP